MLVGVAIVVCLFVAETFLPLLFFCWMLCIIANQADALPQTSLHLPSQADALLLSV
jgi:hypothetical protein